MAQLTRAVAPMTRPPVTARQVEALVQPEVWTMYDTYILGSTANGADTTAAALAASFAMFNSHTVGAKGAAITSMTTSSGYVDFPFKAYGMGVEVFAMSRNETTAVIPQALVFVENMINGGSITLQFATDYKLIIPISDLPAGGGLAYGYGYNLNDNSAPVIGASANAGNGLPSVQARVMWKDYILFRGKDQPFTLNVNLTANALSNIQALTGFDSASHGYFGVRVKFWGYRGKALITGAPFRG